METQCSACGDTGRLGCDCDITHCRRKNSWEEWLKYPRNSRLSRRNQMEKLQSTVRTSSSWLLSTMRESKQLNIKYFLLSTMLCVLNQYKTYIWDFWPHHCSMDASGCSNKYFGKYLVPSQLASVYGRVTFTKHFNAIYYNVFFMPCRFFKWLSINFMRA